MTSPSKPRQTAKYAAAVATAHNHKLPAIDTHNRDQLYDLLQKHGFFWNSDLKDWEEFDPADADQPTPLINIRVWADGDIVEDVTGNLVRKVNPLWTLVEQSKPYPCRPPKQLESRVYLKFLPKGGQHG